ncbi:hypothetical protein F5882DRAFT_524409 [Hyaloscypha sp. PMI_1271]|nr:hypothetical protein F5882DRAFT_524409 [Hyaloscypha sp. PMI_1271]
MTCCMSLGSSPTPCPWKYPTDYSSYDDGDEDPNNQLLAEYRTSFLTNNQNDFSGQIPATDNVYTLPSTGFQDINQDESFIERRLPYAYFRTQASMAELLLTAGARPDAGSPGAKWPLDAVIKAAHENEVRLSNLQWSDSNLDCFVWGREDLEQRMNTMNVLFGRSDKITLHDSTRKLVPQMYSFRRMHDLEGIPIADLRRRFRERIGEIVVLSDKEFYDDMKHLV